MGTSGPASSRPGRAGAESAGPDGLAAIAEVLRGVPDRLDAHLGGLYLLSQDGQVLDLLMTLGAARQFSRPWQHIAISAPIPVVDAVREGRVVWVGGAEELARRYPRVAVAMPYTFGLAAAPLVARGSTYGVVFLLWPASHPAELSSGERDRLVLLAEQLAEVLASAADAGRPVRAGPRRVVAEEDRAPADPFTAMVARLPEGMCGIDLNGRLAAVTPTAAALLGAPVQRLLGQRPWVELPWLRDPVYEHHYQAAVISGQETSFVALRPPDHWLSFQLHPDATGLTVSITAVGSAPHSRAAAEWSAESLKSPQSLKSPESSESPGEPVAHTRPGVLYHILHFASALTEAIGVHDVVNMVSDQIVPAFGGQAVAVLMVEGGRLRIVGHRGYSPNVVDQFDGTALTEPTPGVQASTNPVPTFFETREELERLYPDRRETQDGMAAWAYLPLVTSGRLIGTCVVAFDQPHRFALGERAVLTALAGLIAQALDRARLYDTKLGLAHGLQDSLLPRALPAVPGLETAARYLPCTEGMEVGGDFYDLIRVDRDTAAIVIGDVQGHNVHAAALMGQIRTAVRAFATVDADPGVVLARTNRLLADLDTTLLASCAFLRVYPLRREAWLGDAGHPVPLVRSPDGRVSLLEPSSGLVFNVDRAAEYPLTRVDLAVGTTLVLYTDGLVETPGVDLDWSLAELGAILARHGGEPLDVLADALIGEAVQAEHRTDDIALLLVRSVPF
ncbi:serine phosphatase RsbU (regulator of sigma subunit)/PAS domain-containing protein [Kitasatospora sp. MAP12-15]|uniref:GAF domain-containing SpoIIE family protein phosphatase n=1 Tax=unclassified Kitasatospora TaxID=2633591 RepID=UPI0024763E0D|nr:GAF domain-containing SpoIIE family protein phosphatase [Kitasatospora sp. MAP12-44]MDH6115069.1 serine phosphatase RsbU (regulator of sigma subunit)/PAS domain-containing protein [Kitasatospora sp. MAP12-44]